MIYCLDASALIDAWYFWYTPQTHPSFWMGLEALAESGRLFIPEQVLEELSEQEDPLRDWCDDKKDRLVLAPTDATEQEFRRLVNAYPKFAGRLGMGDDYADLYVVAAASVHEATVVTTEDRGFESHPSMRRQRSRRKYKITNVCRDESIDLARPYAIPRREGWVFDHL